MRSYCLNYIELSNVRGPLAQLVEQFPFKEWVTGSNPVGLTITYKNIKYYAENDNTKY